MREAAPNPTEPPAGRQAPQAKRGRCPRIVFTPEEVEYLVRRWYRYRDGESPRICYSFVNCDVDLDFSRAESPEEIRENPRVVVIRKTGPGLAARGRA